VQGLYSTQVAGAVVAFCCWCRVCWVIHTVLVSLQHLACNQQLLFAAHAAFHGFSGLAKAACSCLHCPGAGSSESTA